jgi:ABC-type transporter Mla MlaB component
MLEIRVVPSPAASATVVKVVGRLDRFSAPVLSRGLADFPGFVRLDCSELSGIDSTGFDALLALHELRRARGDRLVVSGLALPPREEWASWPGLDQLDLGDQLDRERPDREDAARAGVAS